jgi:Protein phosphatase 2C
MASVAGHAGRVNEDFVGAVPTAAVLLDGAGGVSGGGSVCRHGVAWYATRLGGELLGLLSLGADRTLAALLAEAIDRVADAHRDTCDLADPRSPWAAVAILRLRDGRADHLVLGDAFLVLDRAGAPLVVSDPRELVLARPYQSALDALTAGSAEYERIRGEGSAAMRANRNQPGGYWVAKEDPRAAAEAVIGDCSVAELAGAALLSNGASRIVDQFRLADWPQVLATLASSGPADGPAEIIRRVREAEESQAVSPDDATIAHCTDLHP